MVFLGGTDGSRKYIIFKVDVLRHKTPLTSSRRVLNEYVINRKFTVNLQHCSLQQRHIRSKAPYMKADMSRCCKACLYTRPVLQKG